MHLLSFTQRRKQHLRVKCMTVSSDLEPSCQDEPRISSHRCCWWSAPSPAPRAGLWSGWQKSPWAAGTGLRWAGWPRWPGLYCPASAGSCPVGSGQSPRSAAEQAGCPAVGSAAGHSGQSESTEGLVMEKSRGVWLRLGKCKGAEQVSYLQRDVIDSGGVNPRDLDVGPHQVSCQL